MEQLHDIQMQVLSKLAFSESMTYTEMKPDSKMDNNQFDWHVKQLLKRGFIAHAGASYALTPEGKQYVASLNTEEATIELQGRLSAWVVCTRQVNGELEFLFYTRKKHPFYNCQGFPAGKIKRGETVEAGAQRELLQECGLTGKPQLLHLQHYIIQSPSHSVLDDKYMFLCLFENPTGELRSSEEGLCEWVPESKIDSWLTNPFSSIEEVKMVIAACKNKAAQTISFNEQIEVSDKF
jgi:ADP-ribose pyrophosphatase YjhB (NUDIX family)